MSDQVLKDFHKMTLEEASEEIDLAKNDSKFRTIIFSIPEEKVNEAHQEIEYFFKKMRKKFGFKTPENKKIVKLNLQMYPVNEVFTNQDNSNKM